MTPCFRFQNDDLVLMITVQPGASRDEIQGMHDGRLKLKVSAPARDDRANKAVVALLADQFQVARSRVHVMKGQGQRNKRVLIKAPDVLPDWLS